MTVKRAREMPAPVIIKPEALEKLIAQGLKKVEIARHLGVSSTAVTKAIRKYGLTIAMIAATGKAAAPARTVYQVGGVVEKRHRALEILAELANKVKDELHWIEESIPRTQDAEYREWLEQKLKFMAEIRKVIVSMADVGYRLYQVAAVEQALKIMLEEIGRESVECQTRIRDRLARANINLPVVG